MLSDAELPYLEGLRIRRFNGQCFNIGRVVDNIYLPTGKSDAQIVFLTTTSAVR